MSHSEDEIFADLWEKEQQRPKTEDLLQYSSLREKMNAFGGYQNFESGTQFLYFIKHELPEKLAGKKVVFRGMTQAKYRLFNKAQRAYQANKSANVKDEKTFHSSIEQMIGNARTVNNSVLANFFKTAGLRDNDVAILSFLQHYGAPTPFMDWTTDLYTSLYFALSSCTDEQLQRYQNGPATYEIDDYFSFYMLIEDHILDMVSSFSQLSISSKSAVKYRTLKKKKFQYIDERFKGGKPVFSLVNNLHITNQKGLFIYNNSSHMPLEEVFLLHWTMHYLGNMSKGRKTPRTPMMCINFHKSIGHRLRKVLLELGINDETIYSKPEVIAKEAVPEILNALG